MTHNEIMQAVERRIAEVEAMWRHDLCMMALKRYGPIAGVAIASRMAAHFAVERALKLRFESSTRSTSNLQTRTGELY